MTFSTWTRLTLVVALVVDVLGQLAGVVPAGSLGMLAAVVTGAFLTTAAGLVARSSLAPTTTG